MRVLAAVLQLTSPHRAVSTTGMSLLAQAGSSKPCRGLCWPFLPCLLRHMPVIPGSSGSGCPAKHSHWLVCSARASPAFEPSARMCAASPQVDQHEGSLLHLQSQLCCRFSRAPSFSKHTRTPQQASHYQYGNTSILQLRLYIAPVLHLGCRLQSIIVTTAADVTCWHVAAPLNPACSSEPHRANAGKTAS